jgi:hypothetical protein
MTQVIEGLPSKLKALNSNPSTTKNKIGKNEMLPGNPDLTWNSKYL